MQQMAKTPAAAAAVYKLFKQPHLDSHNVHIIHARLVHGAKASGAQHPVGAILLFQDADLVRPDAPQLLGVPVTLHHKHG